MQVCARGLGEFIGYQCGQEDVRRGQLRSGGLALIWLADFIRLLCTLVFKDSPSWTLVNLAHTHKLLSS